MRNRFALSSPEVRCTILDAIEPATCRFDGATIKRLGFGIDQLGDNDDR